MDRRPNLIMLDVVSCGLALCEMSVEDINLDKTQHCVNYVDYQEERAHNDTSCRSPIPSFRSLCKERLGPCHPFLATKNGLHLITRALLQKRES